MMETLEFVIYPDGRVQEKVTGIMGASCSEVTEAIEAQLGLVLQQQPTADFFAQQKTTVTQANHAAQEPSFGTW
jgi:Protein of unknown function (DUF2997)